jgi:uracil DNA glycosylase
MDNEKRSASPLWYRNTAIIFFSIAAVLVWAAVAKHDWVYWAFAGITLLNAVLTTLKFLTVRESGK